MLGCVCDVISAEGGVPCVDDKSQASTTKGDTDSSHCVSVCMVKLWMSCTVVRVRVVDVSFGSNTTTGGSG